LLFSSVCFCVYRVKTVGTMMSASAVEAILFYLKLFMEVSKP
jgi:hypothetical protein